MLVVRCSLLHYKGSHSHNISRSEMKTCFSFLAKVNSRVESYCLAVREGGREGCTEAGMPQWMHHLMQ